jgi:hypothetical protein
MAGVAAVGAVVVCAWAKVRAPLHELNTLQPFCRKENGRLARGWEESSSLPACAGADGCGVIMAASRHGDNVAGKEVLPKDWGSQPHDKLPGKSAEEFFEQLDW